MKNMTENYRRNIWRSVFRHDGEMFQHDASVFCMMLELSRHGAAFSRKDARSCA